MTEDNLNNWYIVCSNEHCSTIINYKNENSYKNALRRSINNPVKCRSCAATGYIHTDETKEKFKKRVQTIEHRLKNSLKNKERYMNMSLEERDLYSKQQQSAAEKRWNGKEEEKKEFFKYLQECAKNIPEDKKKEKLLKISIANTNLDSIKHHPELWKLNCTECNSVIIFDNYNNFQNRKSALKRDGYTKCQECKTAKIKIPYLNNSDDWKIKCRSCDNFIFYSTFGSYRCSISKFPTPECKSCRLESRKFLIRKDREYSRNSEDWKVICNCCGETVFYKKLKQYQSAMKKIKDGKDIICYDCYYKTHVNGHTRPNYNRDTIPYIIDILNIRYNTIFTHAESKYGEFYINDIANNKRYFADAYSEELNLWIEFDEPHHFKNRQYRQNDVIRENRIREIIPNVIIHRIFFNKNNHNIDKTKNEKD